MSDRPNIVFLLTDDQRWDALGFVGNDVIETPNMDELARNGVYFRNAYVTTPICAVSRASILSGQYARRHGIWDFDTSFSGSAFSQTYPMLLRKAGYRIGFIGKFGVGTDLPAQDFDYWRGFADQGVYEHYDNQGRPVHLTHLIGDQANEFLRSNPNDQPFALSISFKAPHGPFIYDPAYEDLYASTVIPEPPKASVDSWERFPSFFKTNNQARTSWQRRFSTTERYQATVKAYYRLLKGVDVVIGRIRGELERLDLADNTVLIFTSDHGFYLGSHGLGGKWYGHEESIRVPFILYDPRLPAEQRGQIKDEMVLNIDVGPTLLSLGGLLIPARMQGEDVTTLLRQEPARWRQDFLYEHLFDHPCIHKSEGLVEKRYKLLRYIEQDPPFEQLYDLERDPLELTNVADDADYAGVKRRIRERLEVLKKQLQ